MKTIDCSLKKNHQEFEVVTAELHSVMGAYEGPRPGASRAEICAAAKVDPNDKVHDRLAKQLTQLVNFCPQTERSRPHEEHQHLAY